MERIRGHIAVLKQTSMKHTISCICISLACLLSFGCGTERKKAQARLEKAQTMFEQGEFISAKNEIDSIRALYPKEIDVLKETLTLMRQVELKEAERNIAFCDSLLPSHLQEFEELKATFTFEKDTAYDLFGTYVRKQQTIERNVERSYIRSGVNEQGEVWLASVYFGGKPILHTGLKLSTPNGLYAETTAVPYDGGLNYRFEDLGNTTEVVTYKGNNGLAALQFICDNEKERIRAEYTGGKPYTLYIADGDKKAVADTYRLAVVLSDIVRMTAEKDKAEKRIVYLNGKLAD
ncbi:hypothetical protein Barb6_00923 [Bacteroidales bacterium Barb6]|nr:hypothetical protein Barb6_00923 [Bacteroidales bacterium Barb6]